MNNCVVLFHEAQTNPDRIRLKFEPCIWAPTVQRAGLTSPSLSPFQSISSTKWSLVGSMSSCIFFCAILSWLWTKAGLLELERTSVQRLGAVWGWLPKAHRGLRVDQLDASRAPGWWDGLSMSSLMLGVSCSVSPVVTFATAKGRFSL